MKELTALGHRLSGSEGAAKGIEWAKRKMEAYGFDRVELQPVMVPKWTRGNVERAAVLGSPQPIALEVAALGNSVGMPAEGIEAGVVEVNGLDEVQKLGAAVRGKIVFYNRAMDPSRKDTYKAYGSTVDRAKRFGGPSAAAKQERRGRAGAVADHSSRRRVSPYVGITMYEKDVAKIPAAALSTRSANKLSTLLKANANLTVNLKLSASQHPPVPSFNVIGELTGRDLPQEIVVVGGHLDSWDLGTGAHDDGAGVVQSIEVVRALKALGLRPRRTVRVVLFMSEEFGGAGAEEYASQAKAKQQKHVAALESDSGGFKPVGFSVSGDDQALAKIKLWAPYFASLHADTIDKGGSGADVEPLVSQGAVALGLVPVSTHYFDFHHSARDRIWKRSIATTSTREPTPRMAIMTYLLAEKGL